MPWPDPSQRTMSMGPLLAQLHSEGALRHECPECPEEAREDTFPDAVCRGERIGRFRDSPV